MGLNTPFFHKMSNLVHLRCSTCRSDKALLLIRQGSAPGVCGRIPSSPWACRSPRQGRDCKGGQPGGTRDPPGCAAPLMIGTEGRWPPGVLPLCWATLRPLPPNGFSPASNLETPFLGNPLLKRPCCRFLPSGGWG